MTEIYASERASENRFSFQTRSKFDSGADQERTSAPFFGSTREAELCRFGTAGS